MAERPEPWHERLMTVEKQLGIDHPSHHPKPKLTEEEIRHRERQDRANRLNHRKRR